MCYAGGYSVDPRTASDAELKKGAEKIPKIKNGNRHPVYEFVNPRPEMQRREEMREQAQQRQAEMDRLQRAQQQAMAQHQQALARMSQQYQAPMPQMPKAAAPTASMSSAVLGPTGQSTAPTAQFGGGGGAGRRRRNAGRGGSLRVGSTTTAPGAGLNIGG
jgi:hypothetical protein